MICSKDFAKRRKQTGRAHCATGEVFGSKFLIVSGRHRKENRKQ
jgi:hypothetical protein